MRVRWLLLIAFAAPLAAQDVASTPGDGPEWTRSWSPLLWTAELPRILPSAAPSLPNPLLWPSPRVGLFWTAGNPGALPFELADTFSVFAVGVDRDDGAYRRPLDPGRSTNDRLRGVGWRPFGERGAALGRVRVADVSLERPLSDFDLPYSGSPYVVMDTAGSALGRTDASLEGVAGWRLGALGLGVAFGYRAQQTRTEAAPVPRVLSAADPGASAGAVWRVSPRLRVGLHGRWRAHAERVLLYSVAAPSRVYWLQGYFEARPQDVANGFYQRRMERDGRALAVSAAGDAAGATWTAFVERGKQEERQHPPGQNNPQSDTWTSDAWTVGLAARRALGPRTELALSGRYTTLSGAARRGDLPDTVTFASDESVFDAAADLSLQARPFVQLVARLTLRHEGRDRRDQLAQVQSDLASWTTGFGVAAAYHPGPAFAVAGGLAVAVYGAGGGIPDPTDMGIAYRTYVAPELSLAATDAHGWATGLSVLWAALPGRGALWARMQRASLGPSDPIGLPLVPDGHRRSWTVEAGVMLRK